MKGNPKTKNKYLYINFQIFTRIKDSDDEHPDMIKAKNLIRRIMKRDFYPTLATIEAPRGHAFRGKSMEEVEQIVKNSIKQSSDPDVPLDPEDVIVLRSKATLGMGSRNPIHKVPFNNKEDQYVSITNSSDIWEDMTPYSDFETYFIVFKSSNDAACKKAFHCVQKFLQENRIN